MRARSGFTIIEAVLAVGLSSLLLAALLRFITFGFPISKVTILSTRSTETARLTLKRLAKQLREARVSDTGAYPLVEISPQRLIFYANVDSDAATERVRYQLSGTNLQRGITKPTGSPLTYDVTQEKVTTVASSVRNGAAAIFTYYTGNYPADTTPVGSSDIADVAYIQFVLSLDADPAADPPPISVQSQVQLRNLKANL